MMNQIKMRKWISLRENILMIGERGGNLLGRGKGKIGLMTEFMRRAGKERGKDKTTAMLVDQEATIRDIWNLCIACITTR